MQKSAEAFRTISEVADDLSLPQHVLRFWETRFPQIRPLKRAGGRRYYRPADVLLLRTIRQLLYDDGYTIKGVQRRLKDQGVKGLGPAGQRHLDVGAEIPDLDDDPEPKDAADAEQTAAAAADARSVNASAARPSDAGCRAAIEEALAAIDECKSILDALVPPSR